MQIVIWDKNFYVATLGMKFGKILNENKICNATTFKRKGIQNKQKRGEKQEKELKR